MSSVRTWQDPPVNRCVAQLGRALRLGRSGRMFESCHTDHIWGISSSGRAAALQAVGDRFESDILHQKFCYSGRRESGGGIEQCGSIAAMAS
jgi:hypothetical protein